MKYEILDAQYLKNKKGVRKLSEESKKIVERAIRDEKMDVLIYPIIITTFIYGVWISIFPNILSNYKVYSLVNPLVNNWQVGVLFIFLPILMLVAYKAGQRDVLFVASNMLFILWSVFAVSFLLSPPPNTVWIFASLVSYLAFSLVRRV